MAHRTLKHAGVAVLCATLGLTGAMSAAAQDPTTTAETETERTLPQHRLWYQEPATSWENHGLPIGNGHLGGVVFGAVDTERIQFNEKTLWTGGPAPGRNYTHGNWTSPRPDALADARRLIEEEGVVEPGPITALLGQGKNGYGSYTTFGELHLDFGDVGSVDDYVRDLDIDDGIASVSYTAEGVGYTREFFASYPDGVLVTRLSADQPGALDVSISQTIPNGRSNTDVSVDGARLTVAGNLDDNNLRFESQLHVSADNGTIGQAGDAVTVEGADSITVVLGAGTDYSDEYPEYRGDDPHERVTAVVDAAAAAS
jgi:alpha-L-fucosidase 2